MKELCPPFSLCPSFFSSLWFGICSRWAPGPPSMDNWGKWVVPAAVGAVALGYWRAQQLQRRRRLAGLEYYDLVIKLDDFMAVCRKVCASDAVVLFFVFKFHRVAVR